jgi:Domain of unknown function (DUF4129)
MSTDRAVHELRAQASPPLGAGRVGALALVLCVLAFAGAIAAGGVSSRVGSPPTGSFSVIELAALVVIGVLAVLGLVALVWTRSWDDPVAAKRPPLWKRIFELVVLTAVLTGSLALLMMFVPKNPFGGQPSGHRRAPAKAGTASKARSASGPLDSSWARGAAFASGAALGVVALFLIFRHPTPAGSRKRDDEALDHAVAAGVAALESENDPRHAVIKAYAGMEHALAEDGLPRRPSETPLEYLHRALERLSASAAATTRLTSLFEQARFSSHVIDEPMRREALAALGDLRSELAG